MWPKDFGNLSGNKGASLTDKRKRSDDNRRNLFLKTVFDSGSAMSLYLRQRFLAKNASRFSIVFFTSLATYINNNVLSEGPARRRCPHSGEGEDFLTKFFYGNCCNSGTESRKIDPKVGNKPSCRGLKMGH